MSVMLSAASAASAVPWAAKNLGFDGEAALLTAAAILSPEERKQAPLFLPYLSDERSPHNHQLASGAWLGLCLQVHQDSERDGAMGAARVGWLATGGDIDQVCTTPPVLATYQPNVAHNTELKSRHACFRTLYPVLAPSFSGSV